MRLIGFTGQMGSGKSTAIECLKALYPGHVHNVKFAAPLYDIQDYIYSRVKQVYKPKPDFIKDRKLLQWIGTEWGRDTISPTVWIDIWKAEVAQVNESNPGSIIVCDDVRFQNEAETVRAMGGIVVEIASNLRHSRIDTKAGIGGHATESGFDKGLIDSTIFNNGTVEELKASIYKLINFQ